MYQVLAMIDLYLAGYVSHFFCAARVARLDLRRAVGV